MVFVINQLGRLGIAFAGFAALLAAAEKPKDQKAAPTVVKAGIRTPGIQIPFARLKAEQEFAVLKGTRWLAPTADVVLARIASGDIPTSSAA